MGDPSMMDLLQSRSTTPRHSPDFGYGTLRCQFGTNPCQFRGCGSTSPSNCPKRSTSLDLARSGANVGRTWADSPVGLGPNLARFGPLAAPIPPTLSRARPIGAKLGPDWPNMDLVAPTWADFGLEATNLYLIRVTLATCGPTLGLIRRTLAKRVPAGNKHPTDFGRTWTDIAPIWTELGLWTTLGRNVPDLGRIRLIWNDFDRHRPYLARSERHNFGTLIDQRRIFGPQDACNGRGRFGVAWAEHFRARGAEVCEAPAPARGAGQHRLSRSGRRFPRTPDERTRCACLACCE